MDYLILKLTKSQVISQLIHPKRPLTALMSGPWRITPHKVKHVVRALISYGGVIVAEYRVAPDFQVNGSTGALCVNLLPADPSRLVGRRIYYPTSNLASVVSAEHFLDILLPKEEA